MSDSREAKAVAQAVVHGTAASPTTSRTQAGQSSGQKIPRGELVEAINQVFALFRLNYHNQFYAAFPDSEQLNQIKRLWLDALSDYPTDLILRGARHAIEHSEYLPTLNRMLESCQQALNDQGLPSPRDAFIEACEKPSPKQEQAWSHPAVYFAGRDSDWFFLASEPERLTWPEFRRHYENYLLRISRGEQLVMPELSELPEPPRESMSLEERRAALEQLRDDTGL